MLAHPRDHGGGRHGPGAHGAEQQSEAAGAPAEHLAGVHRQQRHQAGAGDAERERADQHAAQDVREHGVADAGPDRPGEAFGRSHVLLDRALPAPQHDEHEGERGRVQREDQPRPRGGDQQTADGGADRPAEVDVGAAQRDRLLELVRRYQLGLDRLPGREVERRAQSQREREDEEQERRDGAERRQHGQSAGGGEHEALRDQEQAPPLDHVRGGPRQHADEHDRQVGRRLHQRHDRRRGVQLDHHPGGADRLHPGADVGREEGDPQDAVHPVVEWRPGGHASSLPHAAGRPGALTRPPGRPASS